MYINAVAYSVMLQFFFKMIHKVYRDSESAPPPGQVKYSGCAADGGDAGFLKVECDCTEL